MAPDAAALAAAAGFQQSCLHAFLTFFGSIPEGSDRREEPAEVAKSGRAAQVICQLQGYTIQDVLSNKNRHTPVSLPNGSEITRTLRILIRDPKSVQSTDQDILQKNASY